MNSRLSGVVAALVLLAGCARPIEQKRLTELKGTPDLVTKAAQPGSPSRAFNLQAFQVNNLWGADGSASGGDKPSGYRAKITLWDNDPKHENTALAEIFFRDAQQLSQPDSHLNPTPGISPDPTSQATPGKSPRPTYRLNFPASSLDSVLQTLRFANSDVYLFYDDHQWSIGTDSGEVIGSN